MTYYHRIQEHVRFEDKVDCLSRPTAFKYLRACVFLGCKMEEFNRRARDVINICYCVENPEAPVLTLNDDVFHTLKDEIFEYEQKVLRLLRFEVEVHHPYLVIASLTKACRAGDSKELAVACGIANDTYTCDICIRFSSSIIAVAALMLAARLCVATRSPASDEEANVARTEGHIIDDRPAVSWWEAAHVDAVAVEEAVTAIVAMYSETNYTA